MKPPYTTTPHVLLLNGPPSSGKDTAALSLFNPSRVRLGNYTPPVSDILHAKFSAPIKGAFAGMLGTEMDHRFRVEPYESKKEQVVAEVGVSYRQWQKDFSEKFMKPLYGESIFARILTAQLNSGIIETRNEKADFPFICISDCGFQIEVDYLFSNILQPARFLLLQLQREGCDFSIDSREYVKPVPGMDFYIIPNNGTQEEFESSVAKTVTEWMFAK